MSRAKRVVPIIGPGLVAVLASLALLALASTHAEAAFEVRWPDARAAAMLDPGIEPPGLGGLLAAEESESSGSLAASASGGRLFGLREASGGGARVSLPRGASSFSAHVETTGSPIYRERVLGLSVARRLGSGLVPWVAVRVLGLSADGLSDLWTVGVDAGASARVLGRLVAGAAFENLNDPILGGSGVARSARFSLELALDGVAIEAALVSEPGFRMSTTVAVEAAVSPWMSVRAGVGTEPGRFGFGAGIGRRRGSSLPVVDVAWQWHPVLGASSFVSLSIGG
jgi:hypothetical protein